MAAAMLVVLLSTALVVPIAGATVRPAEHRPSSAGTSGTRLTNLAHLDFLTERVAVPDTLAHSTYLLREQPEVGVVWVYADARDDGSFVRVGGGTHNAGKNTWGQGAYDADDIARAAVVYLRSWRATGDSHAKEHAYQQLRGLTYLQTLTGPTAGEVVLWMQPDGSLNPSPTPGELPDPSDSGASYWLARTLWALGEGYSAFRDSDPAFAAFLKVRMDLAVTALRRDVLGDYGKYQTIHGVRVPAWLIVDGADASSEAVLGLASYVQASGDPAARTALRQLARGIAALSAGTTTSWPYRALLPWALTRSFWHAWGANMPAALAAAADALGEKALLTTAIADAAGFSPQMLTSTGPINGLLPTPTDATGIAYGADARVQGLFAVGTSSGRPGIRQLAGLAAGWFFGQNPSGAPVYDRSTGVTRDGVARDGTVNRDSGAESTIHGLLTMQVLDANPDLALLAAASATIRVRDGLQVIEAESGTLAGAASIVTPISAWTGESRWSDRYVAAGPGSTVTWALPAGAQPRLVQPVVELIPGSAARGSLSSAHGTLGSVRYGRVGQQGNSPSPTQLLPIELERTIGADASTVTMRTTGGTGNIDALLIMPEIATLMAQGDGRAVALLTSKSRSTQKRPTAFGGAGSVVVSSYDNQGKLVLRRTVSGPNPVVPVSAGGFTIVIR
jgi:hypothetical protein